MRNKLHRLKSFIPEPDTITLEEYRRQRREGTGGAPLRVYHHNDRRSRKSS